jgi:hypothetical protein
MYTDEYSYYPCTSVKSVAKKEPAVEDSRLGSINHVIII